MLAARGEDGGAAMRTCTKKLAWGPCGVEVTSANLRTTRCEKHVHPIPVGQKTEPPEVAGVSAVVLRTDVVDGWDLAIAKNGAEELPLVDAFDLATRLGLSRERDAKQVIDRNRKEFELFGPIVVAHKLRRIRKAGALNATDSFEDREVSVPYLNRDQAIVFGFHVRTEKAMLVRKAYVVAINAWGQAHRREPLQIAPVADKGSYLVNGPKGPMLAIYRDATGATTLTGLNAQLCLAEEDLGCKVISSACERIGIKGVAASGKGFQFRSERSCPRGEGYGHFAPGLTASGKTFRQWLYSPWTQEFVVGCSIVCDWMSLYRDRKPGRLIGPIVDVLVATMINRSNGYFFE